MKKVLLLMIGAVVAFATHADVTIKVKNDANWGQVNIWAYDSGDAGKWMIANGQSSWTGNNGEQNTWPGPKMTLNATSGYYEITFTNAPQNIIISNGGSTQKNFEKQSNVAGTIYCTSGSTEIPSTPVLGGKENEYTVYIYNKSNKNIMNLRADVWSGSDHVVMSPGAPITFMGKYITVDGQQRQVWEYTFSWDKEPQNIQFSGAGMNTSSNLTFTNGKFYEYDGNAVNANNNSRYTLEDRKKADGMTTIYMHFKQDYIALGNLDYAPKCHIYKQNGGEYTTGQWQILGPSGEDMYLVNGKYQIWGFDIPTNRVNEFDNVIFYFRTSGTISDGPNSWREYRTDNVSKMYGNANKPVHDGAHWATFIYATGRDGGTNGAVQTYLSYDRFDFRDKENTPRQFAYVVGSPALTFTPRTDNAVSDGLAWDLYHPATAYAEDGCFYMHLVPDFNKTVKNDTGEDVWAGSWEQNPPSGKSSRKMASFKVGWVHVGKAKDWATENNLISAGTDYSQRAWSTFDLGIIGVNDLDSRITQSGNEKIVLERQGQNSKFYMNTSVSYSNYNQYDWCLVQDSYLAQSGQEYYAVIDTHSECRSVTLCTFNPQPSINVTPSEIKVAQLTPEQARALHSDEFHLNAAEHNGHILMDKVNYCEGNLEIDAASEEVVNAAGFTPTYTIRMNELDVLEVEGKPSTLTVAYMPLATEDAIDVRAKYTDNETGITFHSLLGHGTLSGEFQPKAPSAKIESATYVLDKDGTFGVWMPDITLSVADDMYSKSVYGDFIFDKGYAGQIVHKNHPMAKEYSNIAEKALNNWTPLEDENNYDFENLSNDWASKIIRPDINLPVYLPNVVNDVTAFEDLPKNLSITGTAYAVYPFIYQIVPQITAIDGVPVETTPASAPAQRASGNIPDLITENNTLPADLSGYAINKMVLPYALNVNVGSGVISGVENVEADSSDAPAEYFTVAGVRVAGEPTPGIYLRRQGSKVEKVVIR